MRLRKLETSDGKYRIIDTSIRVNEELTPITGPMNVTMRNAKGEEFITPARMVKTNTGIVFMCPCELIIDD